MCRLSWNLGASTSCIPQALSRSIMGLLNLYIGTVAAFRRIVSVVCTTKLHGITSQKTVIDAHRSTTSYPIARHASSCNGQPIITVLHSVMILSAWQNVNLRVTKYLVRSPCYCPRMFDSWILYIHKIIILKQCMTFLLILATDVDSSLKYLKRWDLQSISLKFWYPAAYIRLSLICDALLFLLPQLVPHREQSCCYANSRSVITEVGRYSCKVSSFCQILT